MPSGGERPSNPFAAENAGLVYDRGRPFHHRRSLSRVRMLVGDEPVGHAIDVACGTGMSTVALAEHATSVVGIDASREMLRAARRSSGMSYLLGHAERLPVADDTVDAVTCCSGIHWFDQRRFFDELRRVIRRGGWVALYDHYFFGKMAGVPEFGPWTKQMLETFPMPERNPQVGDPRSDTPRGFEKIADDFWEDDITMTQQEFADYQLTISNFVHAVESGRPRSELRAWLIDSTTPMFDGTPTRVLHFLGSISCLRLVA